MMTDTQKCERIITQGNCRGIQCSSRCPLYTTYCFLGSNTIVKNAREWLKNNRPERYVLPPGPWMLLCIKDRHVIYTDIADEEDLENCILNALNEYAVEDLSIHSQKGYKCRYAIVIRDDLCTYEGENHED